MDARDFDSSWLGSRPYRDFHPRFKEAIERSTAWPLPEEYNALVSLVPRATDAELPRFVTQVRDAVARAGGYEQHVAKLAAVPTREKTWHDFFNMAVWAHFPKIRWALNALHVDPEVGPKDPRNGRAPAQNLAATFDESGMLVVSTSQSMLDELSGLRFKRAFWERRDELVATTRFWVVGHGTLESALNRPRGLTVRSLQLRVSTLPSERDGDALDAFRFELDARAATLIRGFRTQRTVLDPVPLLCVPGYADNDSADFYDDLSNVRFVPQSRKPPSVSDSSA